MADYYASLASSTATAVDSAAKHNIQCRVSTDHLLNWMQDDVTSGETVANILKKDKMNYCMHKVYILATTHNLYQMHHLTLST